MLTPSGGLVGSFANHLQPLCGACSFCSIMLPSSKIQLTSGLDVHNLIRCQAQLVHNMTCLVLCLLDSSKPSCLMHCTKSTQTKAAQRQRNSSKELTRISLFKLLRLDCVATSTTCFTHDLLDPVSAPTPDALPHTDAAYTNPLVQKPIAVNPCVETETQHLQSDTSGAFFGTYSSTEELTEANSRVEANAHVLDATGECKLTSF